ncbi:MAG: hypothetical protein ACXVJE_23110 [Mucilaginibacter sp.]
MPDQNPDQESTSTAGDYSVYRKAQRAEYCDKKENLLSHYPTYYTETFGIKNHISF